MLVNDLQLKVNVGDNHVDKLEKKKIVEIIISRNMILCRIVYIKSKL